MGVISNLLRWKDSVTLKNEKGAPILGKDGKPVVVWVRIITDKDLEEAFKKARIASARMRAKLLDEQSDEYQALIAPFDDADRDACYEMSLAGMGAGWISEALSTVVRPDLPKLDEIARDPDAPTLEEQERLDALIADVETKYQADIEEFVQTKQTEAKTMLDAFNDEQIREQAKISVLVTLPLEVFLSELAEQKVWRAVFTDEACTVRGFSDVEDYRSSVTVIKEQIRAKYDELEEGHSDLKN